MEGRKQGKMGERKEQWIKSLGRPHVIVLCLVIIRRGCRIFLSRAKIQYPLLGIGQTEAANVSS